MSLSELKNWFSLIQQAPEYLRQYLETTFWVLIFLLLLWTVLKILFSKQFKELYRVIGAAAKKAGEVGKIVAKEAAQNLYLPEPYPRLTRFFAVLFLIICYLTAFFFACFTLAFAALLILSNTPSFWARTGGMLFLLIPSYFGLFFFAQSEKDRMKLFKKNSNENS